MLVLNVLHIIINFVEVRAPLVHHTNPDLTACYAYSKSRSWATSPTCTSPLSSYTSRRTMLTAPAPQPHLDPRLALPHEPARTRRTRDRTGVRERRARDVARRAGRGLCWRRRLARVRAASWSRWVGRSSIRCARRPSGRPRTSPRTGRASSRARKRRRRLGRK